MDANDEEKIVLPNSIAVRLPTDDLNPKIRLPAVR
jgi:hypothetical protein